jgi:hypothetical protein
MAENWQNGEKQIKACRDCFKAVDETNAGLTKAKACVSEFLKMENEVVVISVSSHYM